MRIVSGAKPSGRVVGIWLSGAILAGLLVGGALSIWRPPASGTTTTAAATRPATASAAVTPSRATASRSASASPAASPSASAPAAAPATFVPAPWATQGLELSDLKSVTRTADGAVVITVDRLTFYNGARAKTYYDAHPELERAEYAVVNQSRRIYTFTLVTGTPVFLGPMIGLTDPPAAADAEKLITGFQRAKGLGNEVFVWLRHNDKDHGWVTYLAEQYFP
jgi:hypothetical protein